MDGHFRGWEEELEYNTEKEGTYNGERGRRIMKPREEGTQISGLACREVKDKED